MPNQTFKIEIKNPIDKQKIADPAGLLRALLVTMKLQNVLTVSHIQEKYASFPKDQPPTMDGLRVITNRLRSSYTDASPAIDGNNITSSIGSNVEYAAIQEFGGQTAAHDIVARNGKALAIGFGGKFFSAGDFQAVLQGTRGNYRKMKTDLFIQENGIIFRKKVHHPGSNIPARQPVQRGIEDRLPDYSQALDATISKFLNN